ncbi:unnamed protein product [Cylicocyclus nassatus]|uniref:Uncharacterized protein n=1 Tax=Cylicocyclus nassatus TaxID=53992 RepID=A0AA36HDV1_CYLNA|nr:unnamed protein product [Cylicocyclus nassatus]
MSKIAKLLLFLISTCCYDSMEMHNSSSLPLRPSHRHLRTPRHEWSEKYRCEPLQIESSVAYAGLKNVEPNIAYYHGRSHGVVDCFTFSTKTLVMLGFGPGEIHLLGASLGGLGVEKYVKCRDLGSHSGWMTRDATRNEVNIQSVLCLEYI